MNTLRFFLGTFAPARRALLRAIAIIWRRWPEADFEVSTVEGLFVNTSWNAAATLLFAMSGQDMVEHDCANRYDQKTQYSYAALPVTYL